MLRINATCSIDDLGSGHFAVHVWGEPPFAHARNYTIKAKDDNSAAQEAIRLFTDEMECLHDTVAKEE